MGRGGVREEVGGEGTEARGEEGVVGSREGRGEGGSGGSEEGREEGGSGG